jgi:hypothetical protein
VSFIASATAVPEYVEGSRVAMSLIRGGFRSGVWFVQEDAALIARSGVIHTVELEIGSVKVS